jgi:hypothetical protein
LQKTHRCRAHIAKKAAEHAHVCDEMLVLRCINLKLLMTEMGHSTKSLRDIGGMRPVLSH